MASICMQGHMHARTEVTQERRAGPAPKMPCLPNASTSLPACMHKRLQPPSCHQLPTCCGPCETVSSRRAPVARLRLQQGLHAELGDVGARDAARRLLQQLVIHAQHQLPLPALPSPRRSGELRRHSRMSASALTSSVSALSVICMSMRTHSGGCECGRPLPRFPLVLSMAHWRIQQAAGMDDGVGREAAADEILLGAPLPDQDVAAADLVQPVLCVADAHRGDQHHLGRRRPCRQSVTQQAVFSKVHCHRRWSRRDRSRRRQHQNGFESKVHARSLAPALCMSRR